MSSGLPGTAASSTPLGAPRGAVALQPGQRCPVCRRPGDGEVAAVSDVTEHERGTCLVVEARGEFDLANAAELVAPGHAAVEDRRELVVVDLSEVTLMDSAAVHALLSLSEHAAARRVRVVLVPAAPPVQRIFALAGVEGALSFAIAR
jgi:anti-anti-sigma factor